MIIAVKMRDNLEREFMKYSVWLFRGRWNRGNFVEILFGGI